MAFKMTGWTAFDAVGSGIFGGSDNPSGKMSEEDAEEIKKEVKYNTGGAASIGQMISKQQLKR